MSEKLPIDWEGIEGHYRAGVRSLRDIAAEYGLGESGIRKRAKRDGWVRDLSEKIAAAAAELVRKDAVRSPVRTESAVSERALIEANAELQANITRSHRADISRLRRIVQALLSELEDQTEQPEAYTQLAELLADPDANESRLQDAYRRALSLPGRTATAKTLAETLKILIALERQAFNLSDGTDPEAERIKAAAEGAAQGASHLALPGFDVLKAKFDAVLAG